MSYRIQAHSGKSVRFDQELTGTIIRIGSHPRCGIRIAELEPHALTIEQSGTAVRLHNKTQRALRLDDAILEPGNALDWSPGSKLQLRHDLTLGLVSSAPATPGEPGTDQAGLPASPEADNSSSTLITAAQIGVIIGALGLALWLLLKPAGPSPTDAGLVDLVPKLLQGDVVSQDIGRSLQQAIFDENRGNKDKAASLYRQVRDRLLNQARPDQGETTKPDLKETLDLVRKKLG